MLLPPGCGQVWSAVVDVGLTNASLNSKGTAVLLLKQVRASLVCHGSSIIAHAVDPSRTAVAVTSLL